MSGFVDGRLLGREREIERLSLALDGVEHAGTALLIRGEPGSGKSALLQHCARAAHRRSMRVLRTAGVKSEAQLSFAGLHMLVRPVQRDVQRLPPRQRDALLGVLGSPTASPDRYLVALATLNLCSNLAGASALLLLVDDAQWLDPSTCDVLAFVARRLDADRIVELVAFRDAYETVFDTCGLPELRLGALADADAVALLDACAPGLDPARRRRILAEAAGNPLALIELPASVEAVDDGHLSHPLPMTAKLERAFAARASELPTRTQIVLTAAALNDGDRTVEALEAVAALTGSRPTTEDLEPAIASGLVTLEGPLLRFRHPLVRSAVSQAATPTERLRLHCALADVLAQSPDRRAWHRAAGVLGPDEGVARELEDAANRAEWQGGHAAAVAALERAAEMSDDPNARGRRLLRAIPLAFDLGHRTDADRLLREVERLSVDQPLSWRRIWLREAIEETRGHGTVRQFVRLCTQASQAGDVALALDAGLTAALKAHWFNADADDRAAVAAAVHRLPVDDADPRRLAALSLATPEVYGPEVIRVLEDQGIDAFSDAETLRLLGIALITIPEYEMAAGYLAAAVEGLREQGRLTVLARALASQAYAALFSGDFALAEQAAEEGVRLTRETRQPRWEASCHIFLGHLLGIRGQPDEARALLAEGQRLLGPLPSSPGRQHVALAHAATSLSAGDPADAYERVACFFDPVDALYYPLLGTPGLRDLADAAVATGRTDEARAILERLRPLAVRTGSPFVRTALEDACAVLADEATAEQGYRVALAHRAGGTWRQARLSLAYGTWLRRQRRQVDARAPLRAARELFDSLGAQPWTDRASQELRATGETIPVRTGDRRDRLTAQEMQIAGMAARGLSNRDIGQRLFLSHRTVGSHLYRIFPKLGVTSRVELAQALPDAPGAE